MRDVKIQVTHGFQGVQVKLANPTDFGNLATGTSTTYAAGANQKLIGYFMNGGCLRTGVNWSLVIAVRDVPASISAATVLSRFEAGQGRTWFGFADYFKLIVLGLTWDQLVRATPAWQPAEGSLP